MNIFVTGAGLIGTFAANDLVIAGNKVVLYDINPSKEYVQKIINKQNVILTQGDIRDTTKITKLLLKYRCNTVVHTAAVLKEKIESNPVEGASINVLGVASVAYAAKCSRIKKIIYCSSLSVYGYSKAVTAPITEEFQLSPAGIYDATKLSGEYILINFCKQYAITSIVLRLAGVYGYGLFQGGAWLGKQLQHLLEELINGKEVLLYEKDFGTNEYVYVKDVAQAVSKSTAGAVNKSCIFNIGSGCLTSTQDLFHQIKSLLPKAKIQLVLEKNRNSLPDFLKRTHPFDIEKAESVVGYRPKYDIKSGLADYVKILKKYQKA